MPNCKDTRTDFLHKLSTKIIRENQTVVLEDLNISGMVKNRNPPPSPPGRGARGVGAAACETLTHRRATAR
ncbi:MAG: transposase [Okeania sp. SIO3B5]|uniref:transposase n=1 Tax=Okeania sp. SIO3B5 TaxID=2607811 RepID=UPI001400C4CC|nr:transposase [Okeania sp. SIO3B5]NEO58189.1 transposase [Okeania sp. SIO3B5]